MGLSKKIFRRAYWNFEEFVWKKCKIINTGDWCQSFPLFAGTFSMEMWKRPLRVDRITLVKLFYFWKKNVIFVSAEIDGLLSGFWEKFSGGFVQIAFNVSRQLKNFFFKKNCLSIIFGFWAKTIQPFKKLSSIWRKNFDKVVKMDFYVCRSIFGGKKCFFPKKTFNCLL